MKKILALLALVGLFAASASAQTPTYAPVTIAMPTNVLAGTISNFVGVIDCRKQASVTVQTTFAVNAASTANTLWYYQRSIDGLKYDTNWTIVTIAAAGTTPVTTCTNLNTYGAGYIRFSLTNATAVDMTNMTVKYAVKISAP